MFLGNHHITVMWTMLIGHQHLTLTTTTLLDIKEGRDTTSTEVSPFSLIYTVDSYSIN